MHAHQRDCVPASVNGYHRVPLAIIMIALCLGISIAYDAVFIGVYAGVTPPHPFGPVSSLAARAPIPAIAA